MFAEDFKISFTIESLENCVFPQTDLPSIQRWCDKNKLALNPSKCTIVSYSKKRTALLTENETTIPRL